MPIIALHGEVYHVKLEAGDGYIKVARKIMQVSPRQQIKDLSRNYKVVADYATAIEKDLGGKALMVGQTIEVKKIGVLIPHLAAPVRTTVFSDNALAKLLDLYRNHSGEVGSKIASSYPDKVPTDCITYVTNVLADAYGKAGKTDVQKKVRQLVVKGTELAAYLVNQQKWTGLYYNPDVNHPRDALYEHILSYQNAKRGKYYNIPIKHLVINYNPTPPTAPRYRKWTRVGMSANPTVKDTTMLAKLNRAKFGVGVSKGGRHTWLFSSGWVYEVHWDQVGSSLYEKSLFETYGWLSGAIVLPPDIVFN